MVDRRGHQCAHRLRTEARVRPLEGRVVDVGVEARTRAIARERRRAVVVVHHRVPEVRSPVVRDPLDPRLAGGGRGARLAVRQREGAEVHEPSHRRVGTGLGDHRPAVGVAEQHGVTVDRVEGGHDPSHVVGIFAERSGIVTVARKVDGDRLDARVAQQGNDAVEAPGAVPGPVHQHDRRRLPRHRRSLRRCTDDRVT